MSKVAHYLQEHLVGEVMTGTDVRRYFATDASIFQLPPALVVYPRNENDVRKTARFTWQLAERGRVIPITARGSGSDQTGAAIGTGIMLVFPAHMNRILELDTKLNTVVIEPGINYGKLQQTLHTHGRFLPPYPASMEYSTVGGAIANNSSGDKSLKYGDTRKYVKSLRFVLANGEVIITKRLSKRELNKKLGLATFEGEIYRSIDTLLEDNADLVSRTKLNVFKNNAGYSLTDVKRKDGSFDLTPLIVGSQGTLGLVTEAQLHTEAHNPQTTLIFATFASINSASEAVKQLRRYSDSPSAIEMVDGRLLEQIHSLNPNQTKGVIDEPFPAVALIVEFDNPDRKLSKHVKYAEKVLHNYATQVQITTNPEKQQLFWKIREISSSILTHNEGLQVAVPIVDFGSVPLEELEAYINSIHQLFKDNTTRVGVWGHAGVATLHAQPKLNLAHVGDRQKAFRMLDEWHKMLISFGGTISSESGDGRMHTPYLEALYGKDIIDLFRKVKNVFDPYGTLNPGVKFDTAVDDLKEIIRSEYDMAHIFAHLPRS